MRRRIFLAGTLSAATLLVLSACTPEQPEPTGTASPEPEPTPTSTGVPAASAFRRSTWSSDPYSLGSTSYLPAGATPAHRLALAENVGDRVFFAGEATALTNPGTLQGAIASGIRVAGEVGAVAAEGEKLAVIGAGLAGAYAARRLADAGYDVVLVEARDRLGGRVHSSAAGEGDGDWPIAVELGASWFRTVDAETLESDLAAASVDTTPFDRTATLGLDPAGVESELGDQGASAVATAITWAAGRPADVSLAEALTESEATDPSTATPGDGVNDADRVAAYLAAEVGPTLGATGALSSWYGFGDAEETDAAELVDGLVGAGATDAESADDGDATPSATPGATPLPGADDAGAVFVTGGFGALVSDTIGDLDVYLKAAVTTVGHDDDGVSLRLSTGESISVDRVVVTVPIGVLQSDAIVFEPALPFEHRAAIAALGSGAIETLWLRFDEPFWQTDALRWTLLDSDSPLTQWINLEPLTGEPILVAVLSADAALAAAELSDDEIVAAATEALAPFAAYRPE